jgi:predicted membrane chloride channel (bestrophin family)
VTDFEYYLNKFSKNVITNILRQISVFWLKGNETALKLLTLYIQIFLKFFKNSAYLRLFEHIKLIFDNDQLFYKANAIVENVDKKSIRHTSFNVIMK